MVSWSSLGAPGLGVGAAAGEKMAIKRVCQQPVQSIFDNYSKVQGSLS